MVPAFLGYVFASAKQLENVHSSMSNIFGSRQILHTYIVDGGKIVNLIFDIYTAYGRSKKADTRVPRGLDSCLDKAYI